MVTLTATYLRGSEPYWFRTDVVVEQSALCRIPKTITDKHGLHKLSASQLSEFCHVASSDTMYDCYVDNEIVVIAPHKTHILPRSHDLLQSLKTSGNERAQAFRSQTKSALIHTLANRPTTNTTENILEAFCAYTQYQSFSAWLYNNITEVFTRIAGNFPAARDYLKRDDCALLVEAIQSDNTICSLVSPDTWCPDSVNSKTKWCNAFRVTTDRNVSGTSDFSVVICFYTNEKDYNLRIDTTNLIKSFVQQNLADRYFDRLSGLNRLRATLQTDIALDSPTEFLRKASTEICCHLGWEACSIFLPTSSDPTTLLQAAPKPVQNAGYSVSDSGLTSNVFSQRKMLWSYDIASDPRNSHKIDDNTRSSPKNWIGVPIMDHAGTALGVIRVKNHRTPNDELDRHFNSLDIKNIETAASQIASVLHQCAVFSERKKVAEQREKELLELQDFLRTFRHEIRSPIQAICFAPERLGIILRDTGVINPSSIPKKLRDFLIDFKATGQRLEMIAKALTLDPEKIVGTLETRNLFKDCIAPVMAFMLPYAASKNRRIFLDKDSLIFNIECDPVAMSMAFHVLMDNAVKYSDRNSLIRVFGERGGDGQQVVVESRSVIFSIEEHEIGQIRKKYSRGRIAEEQKLEGSGIGLFLADRIMELHNGELLILNPRSPVRFALRFNREVI